MPGRAITFDNTVQEPAYESQAGLTQFPTSREYTRQTQFSSTYQRITKQPEMININLSLSLPSPWENQVFETDQVGPINFLVGPNGSGKSLFASTLHDQLNRGENARLLGTDRLRGMEQSRTLDQHFGRDIFAKGFAKDWFSGLKQAGNAGSGIDTILLLEEQMDLRIQIEATLSHFFDREIILEWDSGNLVGKVRRKGHRESYRLDREECHGIKELLVLLTLLYNDQYSYIIIDEPELNLHPQYQAFFMQEVRKLAGDPLIDNKKKTFFLITHSPFILDIRSEDDLKSIISFSLDYSIPKQIASLNLNTSPASFSLMRRLNAHHKQLFFSDNPIFVEGILDARLVEAIQEASGGSIASAGSCIIDVGGAEEVNHYLKLCKELGKDAHFLYDLDSLFSGNLRSCIKDDDIIGSFLVSTGLGNNIAKYCGELDKRLTYLVDRLLTASLTGRLTRLGGFLQGLGKRDQWEKGQWAKARIAVMTAISRYREDVASAVSNEDVADIEGRLGQIVAALKEKNIHLLPGGTIERYLPCYRGDEYELTENTKQRAVSDEIQELSKPLIEKELSSRYGELYDAICALPSKVDVDIYPVLCNHLSRYIYELQQTVKNNPDWQQDDIQARLNAVLSSSALVFSIHNFKRYEGKKFSATIEIAEMLGQGRKVTQVDHQTNAGMDDLDISCAESTPESTP